MTVGVRESTQTNGIPGKRTSEAALLNMSHQNGQKEWILADELANIPTSYEENTTSPIPFFHLLERLKTTKRAGWQRFGIQHGESISDHMYRMSILTMMAPTSISSKLDIAKCTRMALIHDMAEAIVGDITPVDNVDKPEKSRREMETMDYICNSLLGNFNGGLNATEMRAIWQEYEDSETLESKFVHDIDKIELILQMIEYERKAEGSTDLGEFTWVATKIKSPEVKAWSDHVLWERTKMWERFGKEPKWGQGMTKPATKPAPI
ncbi:HD domain-domain-containing protein [Clohesyomyces aquaticus]|uniref:5'-deoxynucleotidase n=1 Tax=Clohesyomyces aquaticus TaxID=1231657 RepID=A0A1Y1YRK4_9PLEO|nr:HD domain-domain-containing protein [Clohesyomyces aquaticus]